MSAGTGIPPTSVFRAMRAIARAEAKKQVAVANVVEEILGKKLAPGGRLARNPSALLQALPKRVATDPKSRSRSSLGAYSPSSIPAGGSTGPKRSRG